jgi:GTP cyclohydrolase FolE2
MDLPMNALTLPDIAAQAARQALPLEWVGMCGIALPVLFDGQRLVATADAGVSLDDGEARGIHMSRLYLALEQLNRKRSRRCSASVTAFSRQPPRAFQQRIDKNSHRFTAKKTGID